MKIKVLVNALSALQGGGQTYLLNLLKDPPSENFEIHLLVCPKNKHTFSNLSGILLHDIGHWGNSVLKRTFWETFYLPKFLKHKQFNVLFSPGGIVPLSLFRNKQTKLVTVSQNMLPFLPDQVKSAETLLFKIKLILLFFAQSLSFKKSDMLIFLSKYAQSKIGNAINLKNQSVVIPHGLSELFWDKKEKINEDYALYISSFFGYKAQIELIEAWAMLIKNYPNIQTKLYLIGDYKTDYGTFVKALIEKRNLTNEVKLLGSISYPEIPAFVQSSRLNIFSSTCENCPNILLEYLASERPIMCSNWEPMPEFSGDATIFYNPKSIDDTYLKLEEIFIKKLYDLDGLAKKGYEISKNYNWSITRAKTWDAIRNLF